MWKWIIVLIHLVNSVNTNRTEQCPDLNRNCFRVFENHQYKLSKKGTTYITAFLDFVFLHIFLFLVSSQASSFEDCACFCLTSSFPRISWKSNTKDCFCFGSFDVIIYVYPKTEFTSGTFD